jgi:hypothetical protein
VPGDVACCSPFQKEVVLSSYFCFVVLLNHSYWFRAMSKDLKCCLILIFSSSEWDSVKGYVNWNWETNIYNQLIILCDVISLGFSHVSEFECTCWKNLHDFWLCMSWCVIGCHISAEAAYSWSAWSKESVPSSKLFVTQVLKRLEIFLRWMVMDAGTRSPKSNSWPHQFPVIFWALGTAIHSCNWWCACKLE